MKTKELCKKSISLVVSVLMLVSMLSGMSITAIAETSGDYEYTVLTDGTAEITKYTGTAADLTIPSTLNDITVTSIGRQAFESCGSLTNVVIPDTVTNIGYYSFGYCDNLATISIPASVENINKTSFNQSENITNISVDAENANYSSQRKQQKLKPTRAINHSQKQ